MTVIHNHEDLYMPTLLLRVHTNSVYILDFNVKKRFYNLFSTDEAVKTYCIRLPYWPKLTCKNK